MSAVKQTATPAAEPRCSCDYNPPNGVTTHSDTCAKTVFEMRKRGLDYSKPSDADRVRDLIARLDVSQRGAARELDISEREMRGYCAGDKVPKVIILALERLVDLRRTTADR